MCRSGELLLIASLGLRIAKCGLRIACARTKGSESDLVLLTYLLGVRAGEARLENSLYPAKTALHRSSVCRCCRNLSTVIQVADLLCIRTGKSGLKNGVGRAGKRSLLDRQVILKGHFDHLH